MKVFISWSGERSRAVAELLEEWLQSVLQNTKPWVSSHSIETGTVWFTKITQTLAEVKVGIICLTPENKEKPWILFEAGAIASKLDEARVMTLLIGDLTPIDLKPPLSQFHSTTPTYGDMRSLGLTINNLLPEPLPSRIFDKVFETYWDDFENRYNTIVNTIKPENQPVQRGEQDIMNEILQTVRGLDKRLISVESKIYSTEVHNESARIKRRNEQIANEAIDRRMVLNTIAINATSYFRNKGVNFQDSDSILRGLEGLSAFRRLSDEEKLEVYEIVRASFTHDL